MIGVVIAAIPVAPLILLYPPLRLARRRELRRLRRMLDAQSSLPGSTSKISYLRDTACRATS